MGGWKHDDEGKKRRATGILETPVALQLDRGCAFKDVRRCYSSSYPPQPGGEGTMNILITALSFISVLFFYLMERKGRKLDKLQAEQQAAALLNSLASTKAALESQEAKHVQNVQNYDALAREHAQLLAGLGISLPSHPPKPGDKSP
jgi:hypothetical protein